VSDESQEPKREGGLERHFQSLALALITAAVLCMASFVVGAREEAAANRERLASISTQMATVQAQLTAIQGNFVTRDEWRDHETRVRALESQERRRQP